jgi:HAD domain in Swiss Army Knife RNA repair proteins
MNLVFLDLDGVVNDDEHVNAALVGHAHITRFSLELAQRCTDPVRVARVQRVCDETDARVVIVSAWRRWATVEEITQVLRGVGLTAPVLGAVGGVKMSADLRADAALEWLDEHPEVTGWVVIDDTVSHYGHPSKRGPRYHNPRFVGRVVHPRDGITDADADEAVRILRGESAIEATTALSVGCSTCEASHVSTGLPPQADVADVLRDLVDAGFLSWDGVVTCPACRAVGALVADAVEGVGWDVRLADGRYVARYTVRAQATSHAQAIGLAPVERR